MQASGSPTYNGRIMVEGHTMLEIIELVNKLTKENKELKERIETLEDENFEYWQCQGEYNAGSLDEE